MFIQSQVEEEWLDSDRNKVEGFIQVAVRRTLVLKDNVQGYGLLTIYILKEGSFWKTIGLLSNVLAHVFTGHVFI